MDMSGQKVKSIQSVHFPQTLTKQLYIGGEGDKSHTVVPRIDWILAAWEVSS